MPLFLTPPHGSSTKHGCEQLFHTIPARRAIVTRLSCVSLDVKMAAARPKSESFERAMATSSVSNVITDSTGPNISSFHTRICLVTPVIMVGGTKYPLLPLGSVPWTMIAPSSFALWMYPSTFSCWAFDTSGPICTLLSNGFPTASFFVSSMSFSRNSSAMSLCTSSRDVALQI